MFTFHKNIILVTQTYEQTLHRIRDTETAMSNDLQKIRKDSGAFSLELLEAELQKIGLDLKSKRLS